MVGHFAVAAKRQISCLTLDFDGWFSLAALNERDHVQLTGSGIGHVG